jgi:SAM-dependent methyltransferase
MTTAIKSNLNFDLSEEAKQLPFRRSVVRHVWDAVGAPLRMIVLPDAGSQKLGLTSLEEERLCAVLPQIHGRLLDIGAGTNRLVKLYKGDGIGVDVHDFGGGATIVEDTRKLPFPDASFDTITLIACLNHIPYRGEVLREAYRLLKPGGRVVLTMIGTLIGAVGHFLWWYSEDKHREVAEGELPGMSNEAIFKLLKEAGFSDIGHTTFLYGMNNLIVGQKATN